MTLPNCEATSACLFQFFNAGRALRATFRIASGVARVEKAGSQERGASVLRGRVSRICSGLLKDGRPSLAESRRVSRPLLNY
jgi:hypothetical protein